MKIGILTYYRSHNYGAMLQAVALQRTIKEMGHDVSFISYWPEHQKRIYRLFVWEDFWKGSYKRKLKYIKDYLKELPTNIVRRRRFTRFFNEQLRPYVSSQQSIYDVVIYGSDQIWRKQWYGYGYNPVYYGKNGFKTKKHISYAASIGTLPESEEDANTVLNLIKNIDIISVREKNLKEFLIERGFPNVIQTVDPTFLLSKDIWKSFINERIIKEPYLLFYDLQIGAIEYEEVKQFACRFGLIVVRYSNWVVDKPTKENRITDGPYEFLNLLYYSNFVITSSFHGFAFSLIFQKPFLASVLRDKSRIESLLRHLDLSDRLLQAKCSLADITVNEIDWKHVGDVLNRERIQSLKFLKDALDK